MSFDAGSGSWPAPREVKMDIDFYLRLALVLFVFFLCYLFRNENRKKEE